MSFRAAVRVFLNACPGPPMAIVGLRFAAFQAVGGIRDLCPEDSSTGQSHPRNEPYLRSVIGIAERINCRPAYLSKAGARFGYSFSRALRWIRFLHGIALLEEGARMETVCDRLGFSDLAGWSRFTTRLVGRSAGQLPVLPLEHWVRKAIDDVYFGLPATGAPHPSNSKRVV
ncbi:MAG: hypothetical protein OXU74_03375 [Gemmatimonadota bacterium]|nr:hypothetical protein [Gemmatimonadota bacterium]